MAFYKMSRVTSYQALVIGWSFEHCLTVLTLQNFFTNTISLKLGMYMNFISFQYLKKHYFWERGRKNSGRSGVWSGAEGPTLQGLFS